MIEASAAADIVEVSSAVAAAIDSPAHESCQVIPKAAGPNTLDIERGATRTNVLARGRIGHRKPLFR
jgi:hypothetical protein